MERTFLIIDDDINIRKMLGLLIKKNNLGRVIAELDSGLEAVQEIMFYNPDIVLIDLLLPITDGIEIINLAKKEGYAGKFIMISQVEDEAVVAKAYESGIVFFISKPINNIEAVNVIKGVSHNIDLENSLAMIRKAVYNFNEEKSTTSKTDIGKQINDIFSQLGIAGIVGSNDLKKVISKIIDIKRRDSYSSYQLQNIYEEIVCEESGDENISAKRKAFEQRIRRTIQKALKNIAELGCDDYCNSIFMEYNSYLFDFKQVRQEMRYINNPCEEQGKISTKKFIEGILTKLIYS